MTLEMIDLSGGRRVSGKRYESPNGVVVTTSMNQYSNGSYYYLTYLFNNSFQADARHYWLGSGGSGGYLYMDVSMLTRPITVMRIFPYTRNDSSSNYRIEISTDNVNWTHATGLINNHHNTSNANYIAPGVYREHELPFSPKYIRIYLTYQGNWGVSLNEIQLFHRKLEGKFLLQKDSTLYKFRDTVYGRPGSENYVPQMTSNTAPSGKASASSVWNATTYAAYRAFDRSAPSEADCWHTVSGAKLPQWLAYKFTEPKVVKSFAITSRYTSQADQSPRDFILQGRKQGSTTWENIKSYTQPNGWASNTRREFECLENDTAYIEYRLYVTANTAGVANTTTSVNLSIAMWEMFGEGTPDVKGGFDTFPTSQLTADFLSANGEPIADLYRYNRQVKTLDFFEFERNGEKSLNDVPLKESKMMLDLNTFFDIRRLK